MNFGSPNSDSKPQPRIPIDLQSHCVTGIMEMMTSRNRVSPPSSYSSSSGSIPAPHHLRPEAEKKRFVYNNQRPQSGNSSSSSSRSRLLPSGYFSLESLFLLVGLTASLLILPLVLPPLPPPPFLLLLIPIGILGLLMVLAFTPTSARDMKTYTSL